MGVNGGLGLLVSELLLLVIVPYIIQRLLMPTWQTPLLVRVIWSWSLFYPSQPIEFNLECGFPSLAETRVWFQQPTRDTTEGILKCRYVSKMTFRFLWWKTMHIHKHTYLLIFLKSEYSKCCACYLRNPFCLANQKLFIQWTTSYSLLLQPW